MAASSDAAAVAIADIVSDATASLAESGVDTARVDAELIAAFALGVSRGRIQALVAAGSILGPADADLYRELVARRAAREPLQHLTGRAPFRHLELAVGPGVFVPRPETESVTQLALDALTAVPTPRPIAVDLGTGSGAIALSLATELPHCAVYGVEVSPDAFVWTRRNFDEFGGDNARAVCADLADALADLDGTVDVVVSNPPYIPADAIPRDPEVRLHDPDLALYGGPDGLDVVRTLSNTAARLLRPGGTLVIEHGEHQAAQVGALLTADGWRAIAHHRDLTGRDRATTAVRGAHDPDNPRRPPVP